jgi:hypothetical protein
MTRLKRWGDKANRWDMKSTNSNSPQLANHLRKAEVELANGKNSRPALFDFVYEKRPVVRVPFGLYGCARFFQSVLDSVGWFHIVRVQNQVGQLVDDRVKLASAGSTSGTKERAPVPGNIQSDIEPLALGFGHSRILVPTLGGPACGGNSSRISPLPIGSVNLDPLRVEDTGHLVEVPAQGGHPWSALITKPPLTLGPAPTSSDLNGRAAKGPYDLRLQPPEGLLIRWSKPYCHQTHDVSFPMTGPGREARGGQIHWARHFPLEPITR